MIILGDVKEAHYNGVWKDIILIRMILSISTYSQQGKQINGNYAIGISPFDPIKQYGL